MTISTLFSISFIPFIDFGNNPFKTNISFYIPEESVVLTWNNPMMVIGAKTYNEDVEMDIALGLIDKTDLYQC